MRALLAVLCCVTLSLSLGCGNRLPRPPFDPAIAATEAIDPTPTAVPNDREWQVIWEAVEAKVHELGFDGRGTSNAERMLRLIGAREFPAQAGAGTRQWYDRLRYLANDCLKPAVAAARSALAEDPTNLELQAREAERVQVHNKWASVYNAAAEGNEEALERQILPTRINLLEE